MALQYADGFDSYSQTSDLFRNWSAVASPWAWNGSNGRTGGGCIQCAPTAGPPVITTVSAWAISASSIIGFAFWIKISAAPNSGQIFLNEANSNGLGVTSAGLITAYGGGNPVGAAGANICDNQWHWIEFWTDNTIGGGSGHLDFWCDNAATAIVSSFGQVTSTNVNISAMVTNGTITIDDIWVVANVAPQPNASGMPIGPRVITTKRPSSDSSIQFTPDTVGTNFSRVNETASDEDTSYVQDGTSGQTDLYGYAALGFTPTSVSAIQIVSRVKNPGAGAVNYKNRCSSAGTVSDGTSTVSPSNYNNSRTILNQDPHTTAAWAAAAVDAALFGVTVV